MSFYLLSRVMHSWSDHNCVTITIGFEILWYCVGSTDMEWKIVLEVEPSARAPCVIHWVGLSNPWCPVGTFRKRPSAELYSAVTVTSRWPDRPDMRTPGLLLGASLFLPRPSSVLKTCDHKGRKGKEERRRCRRLPEQGSPPRSV